MTNISTRYDDIQQHVQALAAVPTLCIDAPTAETAAVFGTSGGFIDVLTLWQEKTVVVGLLAWPERAVDCWRCVIIADGQAMTLAPDMSLLVPRFLFTRYISNNVTGLRRIAREWSTIGASFAALHRALGGGGAAFGIVDDIIRDSSRHASFERDRENPAAFEEAMSLTARKIDPSADFAVFADWLDAAIRGNVAVPASLERLGVWQRLALCWTKRLLLSRMPLHDAPAVEDVIESMPGLDACAQGTATWVIRPGNSSPQTLLTELARQLDSNDTTMAPASASLASAMIGRGDAYDGSAHAELAAHFAEADEPVRAWGALTASAWWMAEALGAPVPAIAKGARMLCDEHGWDDVRWVVDRALGENG